jgi:hypothetical protein
MRAFLSYQNEDREVAGWVARLLDSIGVASFMAHEDIIVSESVSKPGDDAPSSVLRKSRTRENLVFERCRPAIKAVFEPSAVGFETASQRNGGFSFSGSLRRLIYLLLS